MNPSPPIPETTLGPHARLPKITGADVELGNLILGWSCQGGTGALAAQLLLREWDGFPLARKSGPPCSCAPCVARRRLLWEETGVHLGDEEGGNVSGSPAGCTYNAQDSGRKFLATNGGCVYIDLDHLELCLPEVRSARDHVAAAQAMLRSARAAVCSANRRLTNGRRIVALANNSDGQGHSYGSHLNVLITRQAWSDLFHRRLQHLLFLAAYQVSSIVFGGQGKVGSENGRPDVPYQISQRADFFEILVGPHTTWNRPIVNSRDEPLCGGRTGWHGDSDGTDPARLHVIFYDHTLCPVGTLVKVGALQIILAMIEAASAAGPDRGLIRGDLALDDPVEAVWRWSHDPALRTRARLVSGRRVTAVELQRLFWEEARRFVEGGGCEGLVPEAAWIVERWGQLLTQLEGRLYPALARQLDWVLKWQLLQRARQQRPELAWASPELKHLDLIYSSLEDGLYWACEQGGAVERVTEEARVNELAANPPEDTRAWARAALLRLADPDQIESVDWDELTFTCRPPDARERRVTIRLPSPAAHGRAECREIFGSVNTLEEAVARLESAAEAEASGGATMTSASHERSNP